MAICSNCPHEADQHDSIGCRVRRYTNTPCACMLDHLGFWVGQHVRCESRYDSKSSSYGCLLRDGHVERLGDDTHRHKGILWPHEPKEEALTDYEDAVANPGRVRAADGQAGGSHYLEMPIQPWQIIDAFGLGYYEGSILSYLLRAGRKGSKLEDLKKAGHFLEKLIELEEEKG